MANPIFEDIKAQFKSNNPITILITINVSVFILINLFRIFSFLSGEASTLNLIENAIYDNLTFPVGFDGLIHKPWTVITYMFTHVGFLHIFWNMVSLFWFGQILSQYTSSKKMIPLYLLGGLCGAIVTMLLFELIPTLYKFTGSPMLGASAGVTAIIIGAATLVPHVKINMMFIGPVKLIYLAMFVIFIDVISIASYSNIGGNLSHLGGALMGYIFIAQHKKGKDMGRPLNTFFEWIKNLFSGNAKRKMKVVHKRTISDEEYNFKRNIEQQEIDDILDKISKSGYDSLSKKEKDILFNASKKK